MTLGVDTQCCYSAAVVVVVVVVVEVVVEMTVEACKPDAGRLRRDSTSSDSRVELLQEFKFQLKK